MGVLYIDSYFLLNLAIDLLALLAAAQLCAAHAKGWRMGLAALAGALWATAAAVWPVVGIWPARFAVFLAMPLIAFGARRGFVRLSAAFLGISVLFGGAAYAIGALTGLSGLTVRLAFPAAALCFGAVALFLRRRGSTEKTAELRITLLGRERTVTALRDTGLTLRDPVTNRPVVILDEREFLSLLPPDAAALVTASEPARSLERLADTRLRSRCRLISCRTIGGASLLLAVRTDKTVIGGREEIGLLAAVSPEPIAGDGTYGAIY